MSSRRQERSLKMQIKMYNWCLRHLAIGTAWFVVFALPVQGESRFFDLGYEAIINSKFVHWVGRKLAAKTRSQAPTLGGLTRNQERGAGL